MADDYTPTTEEVRGRHNANATLDGRTWRMADAEFDRFIAALRAEWEAEQGTEEPEWEYGYRSIADAEAERPTMRRRKAGPWVPVEQGDDDA